MTNNREEQVRKLIWVHAGNDKSLDWILERRDHFFLGELTRDDNGYYFSVRDAYKDKKTNVYLNEEELRKNDFLEDMKKANSTYEDTKLKKSKRLKKFVRNTFATVMLGLATAGLGVRAYNEYTSPERVVRRAEMKLERELEKKRVAAEENRLKQITDEAVSIIPRDDFFIPQYTIDGKSAVVYKVKTDDRYTHLCILVDGSECFISEGWEYFYNKGQVSGNSEPNAVHLELFKTKISKDLQSAAGKNIPAEKIYSYQLLIEKIAAEKELLEKK